MSAGRTVAVVVLGVLLTLTLAVGNVVFAAHATMLDPDFATNTIEEEGGYDALASQFQEGVAGQASVDASESDGGAGATDGGAETTDAAHASSIDEFLRQQGIFEDAVTEEYVESQLEPNIDGTYAYLHGSRDRLNLTLDTAPIAENVSDAASASVANATTAELLGLARGDPLGDLPVERETVAMLDEGPDAYEQARQNVRDRVYEQVLDEAVEQAYRERSNDELLSLVVPDYDPNDYSESEKDAMVAEREDEIRTALHTAIEEERGDELEATVDDRLASHREEASGDVSTGHASFDGPVSDLTAVTAEALTTDVSYGTYQSESDAAKADLASAVGTYAENSVGEQLGSGVDLNEAMGVPEQEPFGGSAVSTVTWFDRLAIVLPIVAVVLIGLVYVLTRSVGRTVGTVGWSMVWAGIPAFAGATFVGGRLPSMLGASGDPNAMQSLTLGLFQGTVGHAAAQSLALGVVGGLLVGVALGTRYGLLDRFLGERVETADGEAVETQGGGDPLADRNAGDGAQSSGQSGGPPGGPGDGRAGGPGGAPASGPGDSSPSDRGGAGQTDSTESGTSQHDDR